MATGSLDKPVEGINPLREQLIATYGSDSSTLVKDATYTPYIPVTYWSLRFMMGLGFVTMAAAAAVLWSTRKGGTPRSRWWSLVIFGAPLAPVFANSFGWIFTEMGRQPWLVNGLMTTATGVSPSVSSAEVWISMIVYTLLYAALAVVEIKLYTDYIKKGAEPFEQPKSPDQMTDDTELQFAY